MKDVVSVPIEHKTINQSVIRRTIIMHISSAVFSALLSVSPAFNMFLPFGTAFCSGVKKDYSISATLGVILMFMLTGFSSANGVSGVVYIGAAVVATALKWVLSIAVHDERATSIISSVSGSFFGGICALLSFDYSADGLVRMLGEMLFCAVFSYFISSAMPLIGGGRRAAKLCVDELCSVLVLIATMLLSLSPFTVFNISVARIASFVIVLFAARYGKETIGTLCGVIFGFAMSVCFEKAYFIFGIYALSGLLGGLFSRIGTPMCIASFVGGILLVLAGFYSESLVPIIILEAAASVAIFLCLPKSVHVAVADFVSPSPRFSRVDGLRRNLINRMKFASNALTDVSNTVDEVSVRLAKMNMPTIYDVFVMTENEACKNCGLRIHCFETLKDKTYDSFLKMTRTIRKTGKITNDDYPEKWLSRCMYPDEVSASLLKYFTEYESRCQAQMRIAQIRSVISDQMAGLSDMLYDLCEEMNVSEQYDTLSGEAIFSALKGMAHVADDVCCKLDLSGKMTVEIILGGTDVQGVSKLKLLKAVDNATARRFNAPCIVNAGSKLLITMSEMTEYKVDVGVSQYCCKNERLCGDSYCYFDDSRGRTIMMLSDGMGSGGRAAVDSTMATGLMNRLIKAGFGFECSLKLLNSAMMFKSTDESLATVDITAIDLFSGQADFYKAGCPETIVLKGKKIGRAKCGCYPAGIVRDVEFDKTTAMLSEHDVVVMMSDGVCDYDMPWLEEIIRANSRCSAQKMSDIIAAAAARRRDDGHEDDITVMVGIINKVGN